MPQEIWPELGGKQVQYAGGTWELTGAVEVGGSGEFLTVEVTQVHDVRHGEATLRFDLVDPPGSLNPGNVSGHFDELRREGTRVYVVVDTGPRTYRYRLSGIEYA